MGAERNDSLDRGEPTDHRDSTARALRSDGSGRTRVAVDLNADLGEGAPDADAPLYPLLTSANVACGFHAGDGATMRAACVAASAHSVTIGAHVSYLDREGFGRRDLGLAPNAVRDQVAAQLAGLAEVAAACGIGVRYVKAHGALYHRIVDDSSHAAALVQAMHEHDPALRLLTVPGEAARLAVEAGIGVVTEGFADRAYRSDGRLVGRAEPGAVITDPDAVAGRAVSLAIDGVVRTVDGAPVAVGARSICVHGDTPGATAITRAVRTALRDAGVCIAPFA